MVAWASRAWRWPACSILDAFVPRHAPSSGSRTVARVRQVVILCALSLSVVRSESHAQQYDPTFFGPMRWRQIGPCRGGRTVAAAGVPPRPPVPDIGAHTRG